MLRHRYAAVFALLGGLLLFGCAGARDTARTEAYNRFAIKAAQTQLWNEAVFRWKQVIAIDPEDSKAYNNLGVAYEALGKTADALTAYERATELEPENKYYRLNHRRCRIHLRRRGPDDSETPVLAETPPLEEIEE